MSPFYTIFGLLILLGRIAAMDEEVIHDNRTETGPEESNIDEASDSFNLPRISPQETSASTKTFPGYILWAVSQPTTDPFSPTTTGSTGLPELNISHLDNASHAANVSEGAMLLIGTRHVVPLDGWTLASGYSEVTATASYSSTPTYSPNLAAPQLSVENLGDFHNFSTDGAVGPMSLFHTNNQANLLMRNRVVSFDSTGNVTHTATIDTGNASGKVLAVDSHTLASKQATFLAIAQESSTGPGSTASVYLVVTENSYNLFTRIQTNSSISAMKLYSDNNGNVMLAMAERSFHCTAVYNSECGLSLIYKITGNGEAEISDAVKTGNASTVKLVDDTKSISLMYSTCETFDNGTETCNIINHFEQPGMPPLNSFQEFSCDPSNAEFFNMNGFSYYLGPSPTCDKHQISLWDNQMDFMNTFNTFNQIPDSWFVVNAGYNYCDASLVMAGVGKEGTTYYSLTAPGANYTKLLHDPQMSVAQMWSAGGNIYCVNKSAESLTLFKMACPNSYIAQLDTQVPDLWTVPGVVTPEYRTTVASDGASYSTEQVTTYPSTKLTEISSSSGYHLPTTESYVEKAVVVHPVPNTPPPYHEQFNNRTITSVPAPIAEPELRVGPFKFKLHSTEHKSAATLHGKYSLYALDLLSEWSSIVPTKNGSILVVPPSAELPCYRSALLGLTGDKQITLSNIKTFCNPSAKNFTRQPLLQSKAASQFASGNLYSALVYSNFLELTAVIRDNAFFEVKNASANAVFTGVEMHICEGSPTLCVMVEITGRRGKTAEVRCYRMVRFRWTRMLNLTVIPSSRLYIQTYSRSERCMMVVQSAGKSAGTSDLHLFRLKSTTKALQSIESGKIHSCSNRTLDVLNVQRALWLPVKRGANAIDCSFATEVLLEIGDTENERIESRLSLKKEPSSMAVSRNLQDCRGDVLVAQNHESHNSMDVFAVARIGHAATPLSYVGLPYGLDPQLLYTLQLIVIEKLTFLLVKSGAWALPVELNCPRTP